MTVYEQLKQTLLKATSKEHREEIMELKFGCEVKAKNPNLINDVHIYCGLDLYRDGNYIAMLYDGACVSMCLVDTTKEKHGIEILGRPINLEDVLIALPDKYSHGVKCYKPFGLTIGEQILFIDSKDGKTTAKWTLGQPAHLQSDETLIAITNLLK